MKSRKAKSALKGKAFLSKKKLKGNLPLDISDSGSDVDSDSYFHDEIDNFQNERENQLSTDDELIQDKSASSSEEEVLPITDDEKDDSDAEKDLENAESSIDEEEDLPNRDAWGRKKSMYYNADFVDEDKGKSYREKDEEAAKAEAEEAIAIQKSVFSNVTADNLAANLLLEDTGSSSDEEVVTHNLASATTSEKIMFLKKTSPEMFKHFDELQLSLLEIKDKLLPLLPLAHEGKLPHEECAKFIQLKYQLLLHYTTNISFYMMLKSSKVKTAHHPVLQRIASYKRLLDQVQVIGEAVSLDVQYLMQKKKEAASNGVCKELAQSNSCDDSAEVIVCEEKPKESKKTKRKYMEASKVNEILSLVKAVSEDRKRKKIEKSDIEPQQVELMDEISPEQDENLSEEKRTITYQIAKNKGLVAHRKKEYRNPRVRHREKYRKAKIRRKGQVHEVVKEIKRYDGEPTGISTHVVRSIKLK